MVLKTQWATYAVHFHHQPVYDDTSLEKWATFATIHPGRCASNERPCKTPESVTGVARCSKKDMFSRAVGRKLALKRAIDWMPRELRAQIWVEYLKRPGNVPKRARGAAA